MTREDHLLWGIAEECMEVAQRASKAARFGLDEVQPGQGLNNAQRIFREFADLLTIIDMLVEHSEVFDAAHDGFTENFFETWSVEKREKFEKFLTLSAERGRLDLELPPHLREDAPCMTCSECGRLSWASIPGEVCDMPQPNGVRCGGKFA